MMTRIVCLIILVISYANFVQAIENSTKNDENSNSNPFEAIEERKEDGDRKSIKSETSKISSTLFEIPNNLTDGIMNLVKNAIPGTSFQTDENSFVLTHTSSPIDGDILEEMKNSAFDRFDFLRRHLPVAQFSSFMDPFPYGFPYYHENKPFSEVENRLVGHLGLDAFGVPGLRHVLASRTRSRSPKSRVEIAEKPKISTKNEELLKIIENFGLTSSKIEKDLAQKRLDPVKIKHISNKLALLLSEYNITSLEYSKVVESYKMVDEMMKEYKNLNSNNLYKMDLKIMLKLKADSVLALMESGMGHEKLANKMFREIDKDEYFNDHLIILKNDIITLKNSTSTLMELILSSVHPNLINWQKELNDF